MEKIISYFQMIMVFLLFITLIGRTVLLNIKEKINPFVLGQGKYGLNKFIEYLFFVGLTIWAYEIFINCFNLSLHIFPNIFYQDIFSFYWMKIIGMILILIGYVLFILSLNSFGNSWRVGIDTNNPGELITTGIFSITRNPIFVCIDLYFIGIAFINPSVFFITLLILVVAGIHYQILQEEIFLKSKYGNKYIKYIKSVKRYL